MKLMTCPLNGPRNISEFVWLGEVKDMPNPDTSSDAAWADYVFMENNTAGIVDEWWVHTPSNMFFVARRNTITDDVIETMTWDAYKARAVA
jgi:sarcosine oxidase, subunit delta